MWEQEKEIAIWMDITVVVVEYSLQTILLT